MHLKKLIASLGAVMLLCLNFSVVSYADTVTVTSLENYGISPAYEIANNCTSDLDIVSGTAHCTSIAEGTDAVTHHRNTYSAKILGIVDMGRC